MTATGRVQPRRRSLPPSPPEPSLTPAPKSVREPTGPLLDYENDDALELAHRLVGLRSGAAWQRLRTRDDFGADLATQAGPRSLAAAIAAFRPTGATVAVSCAIALGVAELGSSIFGAILAAALDTILACVVLVLFTWRPPVVHARLLPIMALVSLIRPISLAAATPALAPLSWYALAGLPLLVGAVLAVRLVDRPRLELHLDVGRPRLDGAVAAAGIGAGVIGYVLLRPAPLLAHPGAAGYVALIAILVVFGGALEELIFRGLVQSAAIEAFGSWPGVAFGAALSTALYWGSGSIPYTLLMAVVGCSLGAAMVRGASLWGVALSHGLMLATMGLLVQNLAR